MDIYWICVGVLPVALWPQARCFWSNVGEEFGARKGEVMYDELDIQR